MRRRVLPRRLLGPALVALLLAVLTGCGLAAYAPTPLPADESPAPTTAPTEKSPCQ